MSCLNLKLLMMSFAYLVCSTRSNMDVYWALVAGTMCFEVCSLIWKVLWLLGASSVCRQSPELPQQILIAACFLHLGITFKQTHSQRNTATLCIKLLHCFAECRQKFLLKWLSPLVRKYNLGRKGFSGWHFSNGKVTDTAYCTGRTYALCPSCNIFMETSKQNGGGPVGILTQRRIISKS